MPNRAAVETLRLGLRELSGEFDIDNAEEVELGLAARISAALEKALADSPKDASLEQTIKQLLGKGASHDLLEKAQLFENLISTYGDDPSEEDMREAWEVLDETIEMLDDCLGGAAPNA